MKVRDRRQEQLRDFGELFDRPNILSGGVESRHADDPEPQHCADKLRATSVANVAIGRRPSEGSDSPAQDICYKGNEQSTAAFHVIKDKITDKQWHILRIIEMREDGITVDEIAAEYDTTPNAISGRVSELKRMGKIYKSGTRKTRSGCSAAILKAFD